MPNHNLKIGGEGQFVYVRRNQLDGHSCIVSHVCIGVCIVSLFLCMYRIAVCMYRIAVCMYVCMYGIDCQKWQNVSNVRSPFQANR